MIKIIGYIEIVFGLIFALNIASDIQFGFGVVLLASGLKTVLKK